MMDKISIRANNVGKKYRIGSRQPYLTLTETLGKLPYKIISRSKTTNIPPENTFWALKNVSFEIEKGEVVGLIGRNGAGKSTLLKILSRITTPTEGSIELYGRVGSLLEVGTGFHPELTGRENIYLNGSILGMKKSEINEKFEDIINFAEIQNFMDTPVKRYSSGMYVRLAFAVAAHIDPEILLVDEVLAVGDIAFQKKCLKRMKGISEEGRTVLFVSHDMSAIRNLCSRTFWIKDGRLFEEGETYDITTKYIQDFNRSSNIYEIGKIIEELPKDNSIKLLNIGIFQNNNLTTTILNGEQTEIIIDYEVLQRTIGLRISFDLYDERNNLLLRTYHDDGAEAIPIVEKGLYRSILHIPQNLLAHRDYEIVISALVFNQRNCTGDGVRIPIHVETTSIINRGYPENALQYRPLLQPLMKWHTKKLMK